MLDNLVVHMMVRDEPYAASALRAVLQLAGSAIVVDTGSIPKYLQSLIAVKEAFPDRVQLHRMDFPNASGWRHSHLTELRDVMPGGTIRQFMVDISRQDYIWIVDGDEVYPDAALSGVEQFVMQWPTNIKCAFLPMIWFAQDFYHQAVSATEELGKLTGRLFRRAGLQIVNTWYPAEMAAYDGVQISSYSGRNDVAALESVVPFHHLQLVVKPYRRTGVVLQDWTGPQPAQLRRDGVVRPEAVVY